MSAPLGSSTNLSLELRGAFHIGQSERFRVSHPLLADVEALLG